jgi:hypothetical protein
MKLHANARTCPKSRQLLVDRIERGWSVVEATERLLEGTAEAIRQLIARSGSGGSEP